MKTQSLTNILVKKLYKAWKSARFDHIVISRLTTQAQHALNIQAVIPFSLDKQSVVINATIASGLTGKTSAYVVMDAIVPDKLPLKKNLASLCAFSQRITALCTPLSLIIDMEHEQWLLRQSLVITSDISSLSNTFILSVRQWIPQLQESLKILKKADITIEDARITATYLYEGLEVAL